MQMNVQRQLYFVESNTIFCTMLRKVGKLWLVFWRQSNNCVAAALDVQMLSCNINRELEPELDSNLKLRNASKNLSIYNIKYMEQTEN